MAFFTGKTATISHGMLFGSLNNKIEKNAYAKSCISNPVY